MSAQQQYELAEPILVTSYATLRAALTKNHLIVQAAQERVTDLYSAWGRPEEAAKFREANR